MSEIEVTDEMVAAYRNALESHLAAMSPKQWEVERFDPIAALNRGVRVGLKGVFAHLASQPGNAISLDCYDAGLLSDFGGGNVEWWWDYMRAELARAHDHYQSQLIAAAPAPSAGRGTSE